MLFFVIGFWAATIYKRFGALWLTLVLVGLGLLLVAAIWIIGRLDAWVQVFAWFGSAGHVWGSRCGRCADRRARGGSFVPLRERHPDPVSAGVSLAALAQRPESTGRPRDAATSERPLGGLSAAGPARRCRPRG